MKTSELLELVRAGFTKDEILAMNGQQEEEAEKPEENEPEAITEDPQAADTQESAAANQPEDNGKLIQMQNQMDQLVKAVELMSNRIISSNVNATVTEGEPSRGVSQILAEVINPPKKGE